MAKFFKLNDDVLNTDYVGAVLDDTKLGPIVVLKNNSVIKTTVEEAEKVKKICLDSHKEE